MEDFLQKAVDYSVEVAAFFIKTRLPKQTIRRFFGKASDFSLAAFEFYEMSRDCSAE